MFILKYHHSDKAYILDEGSLHIYLDLNWKLIQNIVIFWFYVFQISNVELWDSRQYTSIFNQGVHLLILCYAVYITTSFWLHVLFYRQWWCNE